MRDGAQRKPHPERRRDIEAENGIRADDDHGEHCPDNPKRAASGVASGAAAIEASPATAVLRPIIEAEWPRLSRMTLSSGMATPMAMPTTLIEAIAAEIDSQWVRWSAAVFCWIGRGSHAAFGPDKWGFRWRETGAVSIRLGVGGRGATWGVAVGGRA